jgi:hypothetical protein
VAQDQPTPRPIQEDRGRSFFDKRVDAMLAVLTGQTAGQTFRTDLQTRAAELYAKHESDTRSYAESWILAIRDVLLEDGVLNKDTIEARLEDLQRALDAQR